MSIYESLRTAMTGLTTNKLRAALTMLGIIIGVASVVTLLSVGEGVEETISNQIQSIGSNLLFVFPEQPDDSIAPVYLTREDAEALADPFNAPALAAVSPVAQGTLRAAHEEKAANLTVSGTNGWYSQVRSLDLALGGFLTENDLNDQARVAVLGWRAYSDLFANGEYPVGQMITIDGIRFEVVGILEEVGGFGNDDNTIYIPLTTAQARFFTQRTLSGERPVATIYASAVDETQVDDAAEQITEVLRERHELATGDADDFRVTSQQAILDIASQITGVLTIFLGAIAGISLLVGGIGIMNIMLVSVTERTREVGIRKAVGATKRDVLLQFLLESIALSFLGGVLGISLGMLGANVISNLTPDLTAKVTLGTLVLAAGVAGVVGMVFGVYPAMRAAALRPIEALRYE
ncbi:MAG TPA: ABC transporter permease [Anaerolineae bacterium]|nr:ABC transporter permease [Anaerolineae bacterium]